MKVTATVLVALSDDAHMKLRDVAPDSSENAPHPSRATNLALTLPDGRAGDKSRRKDRIPPPRNENLSTAQAACIPLDRGAAPPISPSERFELQTQRCTCHGFSPQS
jgi:hypothetical protein